MKKEVLKDYDNRIIGYIETDNQGNQIAKDFYNVILGKYYVKRNETTDFGNRVVGRGNLLSGLIYQNAIKEEQKRARNVKKKKEKR